MTREWRRRAACRDADPELFHPVSVRPGSPGYDRQVAEALAWCQDCPVTANCLAWAHETGDRWAVLGATAPHERRQQQLPQLRTCQHCGGQYRGTARYCSPQCRAAGYRKAQYAPKLAELVPTIRQLAWTGHSDQQIADQTGLRPGQVQYLRSRERIPAGRAPGGAGRWPLVRTGAPS